MSMHYSESEVYQCPAHVKHPEFQNRCLVGLGMITGVMVNEAQIHLDLVLPFVDAMIRPDLVGAIHQAVVDIAGGLKVEVRVIELAQKKEMDSQMRQEYS